MKKKINICCCLFLALSVFILPFEAKAETLKDYQDKLNAYINEVNSAKDAINKNQQEIKKIEQQIETIKSEMKALTLEIEKMKEEVAKYNEEIRQKSWETKELLQYLQIANGENIYLEYALQADTMSDFIYRMAVVEQLTDYNAKMVKELEGLIQANIKREEEIHVREGELTAKQNDLNSKMKSIGQENIALSESAVSSEQQVKIYQDIVNRYINAGCKPNDVIGVDCAKNVSAAGFRIPISFGYVTSEYEWRWGTLHQGIDMSNGNPYNTRIYPIADGVVSAKYTDYYGALVVAVEHYYNGKYYTSLYAHLSSYAPNIYVGRVVTTDDYLGYMGDTGWATGPHLHLEVADCRLYNAYDPNCNTWNNYAAYQMKLYNQGFKGAREFIYFPDSWSSR